MQFMTSKLLILLNLLFAIHSWPRQHNLINERLHMLGLSLLEKAELLSKFNNFGQLGHVIDDLQL